MNIKRRAIFLDRDGVINDTIDRGDDFLVEGKKVRWTAPFSYDEFKMKNGVEAALSQMGALGFLRILVTNQPDIAYGRLPAAEHERIMSCVAALPFDDIFICFHRRSDGCLYKKPKPGMLLQASEKWEIDLSASIMIGDTLADLEAGRAVDCTTILISHDYNQDISAERRVANLLEATEIIKNN